MSGGRNTTGWMLYNLENTVAKVNGKVDEQRSIKLQRKPKTGQREHHNNQVRTRVLDRISSSCSISSIRCVTLVKNQIR
jgi:hypothetical protein